MDAQLNVDEHVRRIVAIHFDSESGAPYWLERQRALGLSARDEIRTMENLVRLGPMDEDALRTRPIMDFVPRSQRGNLAGATITETGGTTGKPKRTIFSRREFREAFVDPFVRVADLAGFPRGGLWLWAGPSGPHVIAQAAAACAVALDSTQPFAVDFDPRWFRKLPTESLARERYMTHLIDQAVDVVRCEPVSVIFTTPVILKRLAECMTPEQREGIRGVHYGGMRVEPDLLRSAQTDWFPNAIHLAGYGNSLVGVCMEFGGSHDRALRYYPFGVRHHVRIDHDGRVWMTRLDPTVLIANLRERDVGTAVSAPGPNHPEFGRGIEDPRPDGRAAEPHDVGIY